MDSGIKQEIQAIINNKPLQEETKLNKPMKAEEAKLHHPSQKGEDTQGIQMKPFK